MKCPFNKMRPCDPECGLYRRGMRYFDDGRTPVPFETCTLNHMTDMLESMVNRSIGQQQVMEQVRNEVRALTNIFGIAVEQRLKS